MLEQIGLIVNQFKKLEIRAIVEVAGLSDVLKLLVTEFAFNQDKSYKPEFLHKI